MTRAPVTLSREMKILITALGLVALLGGWLILNNRQQADSSAATPVNTTAPVTTTTPGTASAPGTAGTAGSTPSTGAGGTGTGAATSGTGAGTATGSGTLPPVTSGVAVTGDGKTEVATLPPFPVTGPNGTTPDPTLVAVVPRGINPDQPLNSLSANNPFRPFRVTPGPGTTATGSVNSSGTQPTSSAGPVTISRPSASESEINGALAGGALPVPTIPGAGNTNATSGSTSGSLGNGASAGGALPIPTIPGATAGTGGVTAIPSPTGSTGSTGSGVVSGNAPTASTTPATSTQPTKPPLAGVSEPTTVAVPDTFATAGTAAGSGSAGTGTGTGTAGTGSATGGASAAAGLNPANLNTPQVISDLNAPADSGSAVSAVETAIRANGLVFNAAVLGPVNTAVFRSDKGFVVATVGQAIPNTDIILKEVTATTATLTSGNTTKTLELDKR